MTESIDNQHRQKQNTHHLEEGQFLESLVQRFYNVKQSFAVGNQTYSYPEYYRLDLFMYFWYFQGNFDINV